MLGLILCIAGISSTGSSSTDQRPKIGTTTKVGAILYIVGYVGCCLIFLVTWVYIGSVPRREKTIYLAVAIAVPLIAVRLLYEALSVFLNNEHFAVYGGSEVLNLAMGVAEELIVAVDYVALGLALRPLQPDEQGQLTSRAWKEESPEQPQRPALAPMGGQGLVPMDGRMKPLDSQTALYAPGSGYGRQ